MDDATYQRFMTKVSLSRNANYRQINEEDRSPMTNACWLWLGAKTPDGYGKLQIGGRTVYAHRLAYEHWHEPVDDGLRILHRCDTPACMNPDHLQPGTQADNVADMYAKNRQFVLYGEYHGNAKLTADLVREIRLLGAALSSYELGRQYGVSQRCIRRVILRETWQHVA